MLDAVGSEQAVIFGDADACFTAMLFAAVHADRTRGLILFNAAARYLADTDYSLGRLAQEELDRLAEFLDRDVGDRTGG